MFRIGHVASGTRMGIRERICKGFTWKGERNIIKLIWDMKVKSGRTEIDYIEGKK